VNAPPVKLVRSEPETAARLLDDYLSTEELAAELGIAPITLKRWQGLKQESAGHSDRSPRALPTRCRPSLAGQARAKKPIGLTDTRRTRAFSKTTDIPLSVGAGCRIRTNDPVITNYQNAVS
jgi:hypothetical protein